MPRPGPFGPTVLTLGLAAAPAAAAIGTRLVPIPDPAPQTGGLYGSAVAGLSDVNGDGVADLAVGAPGAGRVHVISGSTRALIRTLTDPQNVPSGRFGFAVREIGDVNGDGTADLAVGAPGPIGIVVVPCLDPAEPACPRPEWGRVLLFSGDDGTLIRKVVPAESEFLQFGTSLAAPGDVNGDGVPDLAVGAPVLQSFWGEVYAFSGATGAQLWVRKEPPFPAEKQPIASFGAFLDDVADVNGDGRRDLVTSAPFHDYDAGPASVLAGTAYVLSGSSGAVLRTHPNPTPTDDDLFGGGVAGIGDQDGDGREDYGAGERGASLLHLFSGASGGPIGAPSSPADESGGGYFTFAHVDDRDADGRDDFWVGALMTGTVSLVNRTGTLLAQAADPTPGGGDFGASLARTGDLGGDAGPDVVVGEPAEGTGRAHLVFLNRPPIANAGPDQTVSADGACLGQVTLDGTGSSDPDGDALTYTWSGPFGTATGATAQVSLSLGTHTVTLTVDDGNGGTDTDTVEITIVDTTPPDVSAVVPSPSVLWPPNRRMRAVTLDVSVTDACDTAPACVLASIASSEPADGLGDGRTPPDAAITGPFAAELRAERSGGGGPGRTYTLTVSCTDASGNSGTGAGTVLVPHAPN